MISWELCISLHLWTLLSFHQQLQAHVLITSLPLISARVQVSVSEAQLGSPHHPSADSVSLGPHLVPVALMVKNVPAVLETQVSSLSQKDPLEKEMATHSSILAWRIPWTVEPGGL